MKIEDCRVHTNREIASSIWKMELEAPTIVAEYEGAGQFINILADENWTHPLRRPMSVAGVKDEIITIIYKIVGAITKLLSQIPTGKILNVLGPLGNTFLLDDDHRDLILVGGGIGLAPILNLYSENKFNSRQKTLIIGAQTAAEHFLEHNPAKGIFLTTDDGTLGNHGTVIPTVSEIIQRVDNPVIYACGPVPMLKAIQAFSKDQNIPTQISVESYMGCGIGICQGCAIKTSKFIDSAPDGDIEQYSLVCMNGPVYQMEEVIIG